MDNNFPLISIVEGNAFSLVLPLKKRTYQSCRPIDEDIDATQLTNLVVKFGGVEYEASVDEQGVHIDLPATLALGMYSIVLTAIYQGSEIRAAYESAVKIVTWNEMSNAQQYIQGSPIVMESAYVIGGTLTDAELEALKEEYRERNAELAQATADMEAAKEHYDELAEQLQGVAQEQTLTQGVADIRDDISHIDIDTSTLAKQGTNASATLTDTQTAATNAYASAEAAKTAIGTPASGQPSDLFAAIAAGGGGATPQEVAAEVVAELEERYTFPVNYDGAVLSSGSITGILAAIVYRANIVELTDDSISTLDATFSQIGLTSCKKLTLKSFLSGQWQCLSSTILEHISCPSLEKGMDRQYFRDNTKLTRLVLEKFDGTGSNAMLLNCTKLIDLETGTYFTNSVVLGGAYGWNPTEALSSSSSLVTDHEDEFGNPIDSNLKQFLYNIRRHFAANLNQQITGKTITFTTDVYNAIHADSATENAFGVWSIASA